MNVVNPASNAVSAQLKTEHRPAPTPYPLHAEQPSISVSKTRTEPPGETLRSDVFEKANAQLFAPSEAVGRGWIWGAAAESFPERNELLLERGDALEETAASLQAEIDLLKAKIVDLDIQHPFGAVAEKTELTTQLKAAQIALDDVVDELVRFGQSEVSSSPALRAVDEAEVKSWSTSLDVWATDFA